MVQESIGEQKSVGYIKSVDEEIAELVALVRVAQDRLAETEAEVRPVIEAAKERLKMLLDYRGKNWSDGEGYARLIADGVRVSYDVQALDRLIIKEPDKYGWLREYRRETPVRGGVVVK